MGAGRGASGRAGSPEDAHLYSAGMGMGTGTVSNAGMGDGHGRGRAELAFPPWLDRGSQRGIDRTTTRGCVPGVDECGIR